MISEVLDGICLAIHKNFADCDIYTENVEQGLREPCFLITAISPKYKPYIGNRYLFTMSVGVQYFPKSDNEKRQECNKVTEELIEILDIIEILGDKTRMKEFDSSYQDEVLTFIADFSIFCYKIDEDDYELMENCDIYFE